MIDNTFKGKQLRRTGVDPGYLMLAVYLMSVITLVLLGWCGTSGAGEIDQSMTLDKVRRGELLLPTDKPGQFQPVPLLSMDVDIQISGIIARVTVQQHFKNESKQWLEALYVFPLPDESAVDHMEMQIGERSITGEIKEKKEARKTYEAAKKAGKATSLLSQQRPNIFTTAVANIGPGETVTIEIQYQQLVQRNDMISSLRFPMVVGPRYQPGACTITGPTAVSSEQKEEAGSAQDSADLPDSGEVLFAPVVRPGEQSVNPIRLHIDLAAGMDVARVDSLYHGITTKKSSTGSLVIEFTGKVMADRDFVLEWQPQPGQDPTVTLFKEQQGEETFMLLMVMPPAQQQRKPLARETIFILDTSGSMGGESIRQAKKALQLALGRMRPEDRFNVIAFNSSVSSLFAASRPGTADNLSQADSFVQRLQAEGGTEIMPALQRALDGRDDHDRIRQVVFLTDACVSNERELLTFIHDSLGDSRLFMVGIGSAPNSYFMTRAAAMGRGSHIAIGKTGEVREKMTRLFTMLEQPAVTDLVLRGEHILETLPTPLPDVYQGEPLVVVMRSREAVNDLQLSGLQAGNIPWQATVDAAAAVKRPGIAVYWARKKIRTAMDSLSAGADPEQVRKEVTAIALENHLVSRYTSLVAVEKKISRPPGADLKSSRQKSNLPAGWQYDKVFAGNAATATPAALFLLLGMLCLMSAAAVLQLRRR